MKVPARKKYERRRFWLHGRKPVLALNCPECKTPGGGHTLECSVLRKQLTGAAGATIDVETRGLEGGVTVIPLS